MIKFAVQSWLLLVYFELVMRFGDYATLSSKVRGRRVCSFTAPDPSIEGLCHAMDVACVFYVKKVRCLQRSAATTLLLRRYGWAAEMVIGAQVLPFKSHAWVEIHGTVVNDKPYLTETYQVLERC
jgi:hypothetical protein